MTVRSTILTSRDLIRRDFAGEAEVSGSPPPATWPLPFLPKPVAVPLRNWPWIFVGAFALLLGSAAPVWAHDPNPETRVAGVPILVAASVSPAPPKSLDQLFASLASGQASTLFAANSETPFVKIAMAFDPPIKNVRVITVEACDGTFHDGVEFFTFPGLERFYAEGGLAQATARLPSDMGEMRSLAIGLRRNKEACLKSLTLKDAHDHTLAFSSGLKIEAANGTAKTSTADKKIREAFAAAGLEQVLDQELTPKSDDESWIFRFRSDGTFFVYGKASNEEFAPAKASADNSHEASRFSALGEYHIEEVTKTSLKIRLQGERFTTPGPWDGWYCGHSCGLRDPASVASVADPLVIERLPNGSLVIRNRSNPQSRGLPLADLPVRMAIF